MLKNRSKELKPSKGPVQAVKLEAWRLIKQQGGKKRVICLCFIEKIVNIPEGKVNRKDLMIRDLIIYKLSIPFVLSTLIHLNTHLSQKVCPDNNWLTRKANLA